MRATRNVHLPNLVENGSRTTQPYQKPDEKSRPTLADAVAALKAKLRGAGLWVYTFDGHKLKKTPGTVRGNATYAYYQEKRLEALREKIAGVIKITDDSTNALFVTLTQRYNPDDTSTALDSWSSLKGRNGALNKFKIAMRKLGMVAYINTIEAHADGGAHCHFLIIMASSVKMVVDRNGKYRVKSEMLRTQIKEAWARARGKGHNIDDSFVDIVACNDEHATEYITKELKKASACEYAVKRYGKNDYPWATDKELAKYERDADVKKIWAFYFADRLKMRMFFASKGLSTKEPEDDKLPDELIDDETVADDGQAPVQVIMQRKELLEKLKPTDISPFTGEVDAASAEYDVVIERIRSLFPERFRRSLNLNSVEKSCQSTAPP
jgi:hypothetical protein